MSTAAKLTAEQVENLAKEIREFLLEHGLWQDVDIYFNGKKYTSYDPENGKYYWNEVQAGAGGRRYIGAVEQSADGTGKNQDRTERSEERTGL